MESQRGLSLHALDGGQLVKISIKADDLPEVELLHEHGVVRIGKGDVIVTVEVKDLAQVAFAWQDPGSSRSGRQASRMAALGWR